MHSVLIGLNIKSSPSYLIGPAKQNISAKMAIIFLPASLNICFGCSKEPSHRDGSFEYPQHMFWLRNKKNNFLVSTLIWRPVFEIKPLYFTGRRLAHLKNGIGSPVYHPETQLYVKPDPPG